MIKAAIKVMALNQLYAADHQDHPAEEDSNYGQFLTRSSFVLKAIPNRRTESLRGQSLEDAPSFAGGGAIAVAALREADSVGLRLADKVGVGGAPGLQGGVDQL